jgi:organic radical activating enzyme
MKPQLDILDVSASIGCNLQCKGCNHFSNYFAPSSKLDTDQLLEDIATILPRLDVNRISIIGGEPLLNPRCKEILNACTTYSSSPVYLYSNGLLLLQNEAWIKKCLENPQVYLRISIHVDLVEEVIKKFNHPKVLVTEHHTGKDRWFNSIKKHDGKVHPYDHGKPDKSFKACSCPNAQLYNGKLWKCPNTAFLKELLYVTEQSDDEDWQEYLVDGLKVDCTDEELTNFCNNSKIAESVCNMCTARPLKFSAALQEKTQRKAIKT